MGQRARGGRCLAWCPHRGPAAFPAVSRVTGKLPRRGKSSRVALGGFSPQKVFGSVNKSLWREELGNFLGRGLGEGVASSTEGLTAGIQWDSVHGFQK